MTRPTPLRFVARRPRTRLDAPTVLDIAPTVLALNGVGKGSEAITPLARAVVGGLLTSTVLTLFVVPILYTLLIREGTGQGPDLEAELAAPYDPVAAVH